LDVIKTLKKYPHVFLYYALGMYIFFNSDIYFGLLHGNMLWTGSERIFYGIGWSSAAVGALLFVFFKRMRPAAKKRWGASAFILAALSVCVAGLLITPVTFWISLVFVYMMEGLSAAVCAYYLYRLIQNDPSGFKAGILLASAAVTGFVLMGAVEVILPSQLIVKMVMLTAALLTMLFLAFRKINLFELLDKREETSEAYSGGKRGRYLSVIFGVSAAIALMSYLIGVNDVDVYMALPSNFDFVFYIMQVLYIPGLLAAGFLADAKGGKYLPIAAFGCILLTSPTVTFLNSPQTYIYYSGLSYLLGGFLLIYILISLVSIAQKSRRPMIVTTLAAFLFFLFSGLGAFTSGFYIYGDSMVSLVTYIGISTLLLVTFYLSGGLQPSHVDPASSETPASESISLDSMTKRYGITNREAEVLRLLVEGKSTDEIAEAMVITKNSVNNYVSSLLSKTDIQSRAGLIARFSRAKL